MTKFRESRTAKNLQISFSAEAQARTRYDFFAKRAEEEEFIHISRIFSETAMQEYEHALRFFKFFNGGDLETTWSFPTGVIKDTYANLISSAELEHQVHTEMYPVFASIAVEEGFQRAADTLNAISISERMHEEVFLELADNIKNKIVFSRDETMVWRCLSCGYIHQGNSAPDKCPACVKPEGFFEIYIKNW
jgi:rubrerythrin